MSTTDERSALLDLAEDQASRKRFLKMVGGAGAAGAFSIFLAACGGDDDEKSSTTSSTENTTSTAAGDKGDIEIVNYALTLEYLEAAFYQEVIDAGVITDKKIGELATSIGENE